MTTQPDESLYRIEQVAARTGLTKRTLRYYEEIGLLPAPARTEGNYRLYTEAEVARLERVCQLKEALGLTLSELIALLEDEDERAELRASFADTQDPQERIAHLARVEDITRGQLALVDRKLATLNEMRATLLARLARYEEYRAKLAAPVTAQTPTR